MTQPTTVQVAAVSMRFGRTTALDQVSFALDRGVTGLLGPNGAGKTTLIRILATASLPDSGQVSVLGNDPARSAQRLAIRRRLGYMPQEPGFHPNFTTFEFVDYVAILKELAPARARHDEVRRVLDRVGLSDQRSKRIRKLSGGMRRRVALAAALVGDPEILILDEPTVGLDPEQRLRFRELIAGLGEDRTVLLSTHQTEDVMSLCHRVVVMHQGRVQFEGEPPELAALAAGSVWRSVQHAPAALASWRTGAGTYRSIGQPPAGAELLEPTLEDGYLLLLGPAGRGGEAAA